MRLVSSIPSSIVLLASLVALATFGLACPTSDEPAGEAAPDQDPAGANDEEAHSHDHDHDYDHDHQDEPPPPSDEPMDVTLGEAVQNDVTLVPVDELMKSGEKYAGKTIRVEGLVTDMCHHRRGWFGVAAEDEERIVRVAVSDDFLAPEGAIGARASAQGSVEIRTIAAEDIEHYKSAHRFLPPEALDSEEDVQLPTIVATGATFKR